jgi:dTDP-4-amino-4,6-dideoxygalactose transaminase
MQALSSTMRMKIPGRPRASMTSTASSTIGSVREANTGIPTHEGNLLFRMADPAPPHGLRTDRLASVPLFDTSGPLAPLREELRARVDAVLDRGVYILGPEVAAFEEEFAEYLGARHAVGVANGTEALTIALRALGVGPGDDVIVPSFTFYASAEAIPPTGARPVFCDVDPETFCVTPETVQAAMTPNTRAVIAVHLFGNLAPVREIEALGVPVLEDAAQASGSRASDGSRAGAMGAIATFSFFPSKNLGAFGDGGAIVTNDPELADRVRTLRFHGSRDKVTFEQVGYNSRLDEIQAAILRVQLPHLDRWAEGRRDAGDHYEAAGLGRLVGLPVRDPGAAPAWHLFVIRHREPMRSAPRSRRRASGRRRTTECPRTSSLPCAGGPPRWSCPERMRWPLRIWRSHEPAPEPSAGGARGERHWRCGSGLT